MQSNQVEFWMAPHTSLYVFKRCKEKPCVLCGLPAKRRMQMKDSTTQDRVSGPESGCDVCVQTIADRRRARVIVPRPAVRIMPSRAKKPSVYVGRYGTAGEPIASRIVSNIRHGGGLMKAFVR